MTWQTYLNEQQDRFLAELLDFCTFRVCRRCRSTRLMCIAQRSGSQNGCAPQGSSRCRFCQPAGTR